MKNSKKKGFTLIELIVVIAILGILAAVLIPKFSGFQDKAHGTQALVEGKQWATAADAWLVENPQASDAAALTAVTAAKGTITTTAGTTSTATVTPTSVDNANGHVYFTFALNGQTATRATTGKWTVTGTYVAP